MVWDEEWSVTGTGERRLAVGSVAKVGVGIITPFRRTGVDGWSIDWIHVPEIFGGRY